MGKGLACALVVFAVSLGVALVPTASGASCGTVTGAPGYHAYSTQATGISCRRAKKAVRGWLNNKGRPSSGLPGWSCSSKYSRQLWRCKRNGAVIRFTFHKS
jgi:hypothetical protein